MGFRSQAGIPQTLNRKAPSWFMALGKDLKQNKGIYLIALPSLLYYLIFHYYPMYGVTISFKDYVPSLGIWGSEWVGLKHFTTFFGSVYAWRIIKNTLILNLYGIIFIFPLPIILALMLNEVKSKYFKKFVQSTVYLPHFISTMVICGMIVNFTSSYGFITNIVNRFGGNYTNLLYEEKLFRTIYITSEIWSTVGWSSVIYTAALTGIDVELYEAAAIDGAKKFRQLWHVTLPGIAHVIVIMLILKIGQMMSIGADKIILLYQPVTYNTSDVISSYVYRNGLINSNFSYSAAVGLFNSLINCLLVCSANWFSNKISDYSLF